VGALVVVLVVVVLVVLLGLAMALKIVKQYERGVLFRLGRLKGTRNPGSGSSSRSSTCCTVSRCAS
jgi:regulator of protease activity HflC (stomatin/prohibitin superfamily)